MEIVSIFCHKLEPHHFFFFFLLTQNEAFAYQGVAFVIKDVMEIGWVFFIYTTMRPTAFE